LLNYKRIKMDISKSVHRQEFSVKLARLIWLIFFSPIIYYLPAPLSKLKVLILRLWGAKIGKNVYLRKGTSILIPWKLTIGNHVAIGLNVTLYNLENIIILDQIVISQNAYLCTGSHDYENPNFSLIKKPIKINHYVWIASDAFIGPGVTIGTGSIVGAKSIIYKNTEDWCVYSGNPARIIKERIIRPNTET